MDYINWMFENTGPIMVMLFFGWVLIYYTGFTGRDDTDSKATRERSGLSLYTDYGTGCQYIKGGLFGKITPRLNRNGEHICIKPE